MVRALLDLGFPRACLSCAAPGFPYLCLDCRDAFPWVTTMCDRCGHPEPAPARDCSDCRTLEPAFDHARAAAVYSGPARDALMTFKFGGERRAAPYLAAAIVKVAPSLERGAIVTFVPSSRRAKAERGFDPAEELARAVARTLRVPLRGILSKIRETRDQAGLSRSDRARNLRDAFEARGAREATALLVDDVLTTGATADACARALRRSGFRRIEVLTFARAR